MLNGPFRIGCNFLDNPFRVTKFGIKTYVPISKFVAGVNRELICYKIFYLCNSFLAVFVSCFLSLFKIHSVYVPEANFKICG